MDEQDAGNSNRDFPELPTSVMVESHGKRTIVTIGTDGVGHLKVLLNGSAIFDADISS